MIFVLRLEGARFLVIDSDPTDKRILERAEILYDFAKKYKPIKIAETYDEPRGEIHTFVKRFMSVYGISNVRGGAYIDIELPDYQIRAIQAELLYEKTNNNNHLTDELLEYKNMFMTPTDTAKKIAEIEADYKKYKTESNILRMLEFDVDSAKRDIEWLQQVCMHQLDAFESIKPNTKAFNRYQSVIKTIENITRKAESFGIVKKNIYLKYPRLLFDDFVYHGFRIRLPDAIENVCVVCEAYGFFLTYLENRIAEATFDVASWNPDNIEWFIPRLLYVLKQTN